MTLLSRSILLMAALMLLGCGVHTRAAVRNDTSAPIAVELTKDGETVKYNSVAPGTTSAFEKVSFDAWTGVQVKTGGKTIAVDLEKEKDNTVVVDDKGARVDSVYNKENEWW